MDIQFQYIIHRQHLSGTDTVVFRPVCLDVFHAAGLIASGNRKEFQFAFSANFQPCFHSFSHY